MSAERSLGSRLELRCKFIRRSGTSTAPGDHPTASDRQRRQQPQHPLAQHAAEHHQPMQAFQLQVQKLHQAEVLRGEDKVEPAAGGHQHGEAVSVSRRADLRPARRWRLLRPVDRRGVAAEAASGLRLGHRARHRATPGHHIGQLQPFEPASVVAQSYASATDINTRWPSYPKCE